MLVGVLALSAVSHAVLAQNFASTFTASEVAPGIYVLEGADGFGGGSASVFIGDEYVVLIDDVLTDTAPALLETVSELAGRPVDFVINTHVHGDHVGGNALVIENGSTVIAHDNIRRRLRADPDKAGGEEGLPILTFSDSVTLHLNGQSLYAYHPVSAHTDGDAVIHFRDANVIHAGDILFSYVFPYIDLDNGGSVAGFLAAQREILSMADENTVIIAGHGQLVADRDDLEAAIDMLVDAVARVQALVDHGRSEEEVVAENPLAAYHDTWNWSFITTERMTATLYRALTTGN